MKSILAIAIAVLTLAAWGGRIGLLTEGEAGPWDWVRIVGSLVVGLFAAVALVVPALEPFRSPALVVFAVWSVVLWGRSLVVNWVGSGSLPFKLVHTLLAVAFFALAVWAWSASTGSDLVTSPDEAHGQQEGDGETAGLT